MNPVVRVGQHRPAALVAAVGPAGSAQLRRAVIEEELPPSNGDDGGCASDQRVGSGVLPAMGNGAKVRWVSTRPVSVRARQGRGHQAART